jgi:hypothetical protein
MERDGGSNGKGVMVLAIVGAVAAFAAAMAVLVGAAGTFGN